MTVPAPPDASTRALIGRRHITVTVPPGVDPERVEARYRNGVLEVHMPLTPAATPRRIEVKT